MLRLSIDEAEAKKNADCTNPNKFPVVMAKGSHLFPYRTQKLSLSAPMVLGWRRPGRVGHCRIPYEKASALAGAFSYPIDDTLSSDDLSHSADCLPSLHVVYSCKRRRYHMNERVTTSMCIGLCIGIAISVASKMQIGFGIAIGLLAGFVIGKMKE